jgi:hypothetical protein
MKIISIIGLILAVIGFGLGMYCQIVVMPYCDASSNSLPDGVWMYYHDIKMALGYGALFLGMISVLIGLITAVKKQKTGWIALIIGLISLLFGLLQSTHMFS